MEFNQQEEPLSLTSMELEAEDLSGDEGEDTGQVFTFGQNAYGELGHDDTTERCVPTLVAFGKGKGMISGCAGNEHTAFLASDGSVYVCGYNDSGQCGLGTTARVSAPTKVDALAGKRVVQIESANGAEHTCAVTEDGELYTWGYSSRGQTGHGVTANCLIPQLVQGLLGQRVTKVACSYYHTMITTAEDAVYACGRNDHGQLGLGDTSDRLEPSPVVTLFGQRCVSLACGQYHTAVVLHDGKILTMGKNDYGQLGVDMPGAGRTRPGPVSRPLLDEAALSVSCGYYHTVVLTTSGTIFSFGRNDYGQLGVGNKENIWRPQEVKDLLSAKIVQVSAGCYHTLVLDDEGRVYAFGRDNHAQLGRGKPGGDCNRPSLVSGLADRFVVSVSTGFYHSICLTASPAKLGPGGPSKNLAADMRRLLETGQRSDVCFIVEGRPIRAHRCILCARCEPLGRMLDGPMREAMEEEIPIAAYSYTVFYAFLEYLYTERVPSLDRSSQRLDLGHAMDLLALADAYLVESLKRKCEVAIQKSINPMVVSEMLVVADQRGARGLRRRCIEYILADFGRCISTRSFSMLPTALLHEVLVEASQRGVQVDSATPRS